MIWVLVCMIGRLKIEIHIKMIHCVRFRNIVSLNSHKHKNLKNTDELDPNYVTVALIRNTGPMGRQIMIPYRINIRKIKKKKIWVKFCKCRPSGVIFVYNMYRYCQLL